MSRHQEVLEGALRDAIRVTLGELASHGIPADCWLRLAVQTGFPGVELPDPVRSEHPEVILLDVRLAALGPVFRLEGEVLVMDTAFGFRAQVRIPLAAIVALEDTVSGTVVGIPARPARPAEPAADASERPSNVRAWRKPR